MAPVALLQPQPGEWVCDLCAAPGGKSTQIAGRMGRDGFLLCNEINSKRARILSRNIERMGIGNALVTNEHPEKLAQRLAGCFDRVLVDAPCSGEGMFRKEEAAVTDWSEETVAMCANRQQEILRSAACLLRPGGRLVYSTCTFAPEENEGVVKQFLTEHGDFVPETVTAPWFTKGENGTMRMWPHKLLGEGHFAAVFRKVGDAPREELKPCPAEPLPRQWQEFAKDLQILLPEGKAVFFGQSLYWVHPALPEMKGLKIERPGLELGILRKDRFEPAHALALWLGSCGRVQELGEQVNAYLHGDVIPATIKGWCLMTTSGFPIGWGKGDGNVIKNHYPKGLRR